MSAVVFSPYWNVPDGIAWDELIPAAGGSAAALRRQGIDVLQGDRVVPARGITPGARLRQRPGPGNPLGLVKFSLSNPYNVYLHDTNARALFAQSDRARSHGCVRVERAEELARWVLGEGWTAAAITAAMRAGRERAVPLDAPVDVHLAYFTVWVEGGQVRFLPDVYGHDAEQLPLLSNDRAPAPARPSRIG